jgi:serine/threonine-protein kinase
VLHSGLRLGDRYRLDVRIGAGGMGEVWRAFDEVLARVVAVKAMLPAVADEPDFARRFVVEAQAMASVNHDAVAAIHDYGHSHGVTYLVMEFIDGESLSQVLTRAGRLGPADTLRLIARAADGLQAVHDRGIVHRDIKPANLLVRRDGTLLITDFGISRTEDGTQLTVSGAILGTPTYLSPEQVLGRPATALSDVYSLGLTAYECLTGRRPFTGENPYAVALQRVQSGPAPLGADVPPAVAAVVARALARDPADRWRSAAELAAAARAVSAGPVPVGPVPVGPVVSGAGVSGGGAPPRTGWRRASRLAIVCAAVVAISAVGVIWKVATTRTPDDAAATTAGTAPTGIAAPPAGLVACGELWCPAEPMCWGGLNSTNGATPNPRRKACTEPHYWETFAVLPRPVPVATDQEDQLMANPAAGPVCSATLMLSRGTARAVTGAWVRDARLVQLDGTGPRLVHCLANSGAGETTTGVF